MQQWFKQQADSGYWLRVTESFEAFELWAVRISFCGAWRSVGRLGGAGSHELMQSKIILESAVAGEQRMTGGPGASGLMKAGGAQSLGVPTLREWRIALRVGRSLGGIIKLDETHHLIMVYPISGKEGCQWMRQGLMMEEFHHGREGTESGVSLSKDNRVPWQDLSYLKWFNFKPEKPIESHQQNCFQHGISTVRNNLTWAGLQLLHQWNSEKQSYHCLNRAP